MLVLTRKREESIVIGGEIEVQILGIQGNRVRIGVSAPRDCSVHRGEVVERMDCSLAPSESLQRIRAASLAAT